MKSEFDAARAQPEPSTPSRKRKMPAPVQYVENSDHELMLEEELEASQKSRKKVKDEEKRLRRFRAHPPQQFLVVFERATSQRFYVLGRTREGSPWCPEESVELTGSTGNIYTVHIAQQPTCTCPHAQSGAQCKHVIWVMSRVLRARFDLVYQLALLTTELQEIFENAPPIETGDDHHDNKRKPLEDDCPICFSPFEEPEETVYCRATCGQNIHKECFDTWAATKRKSRDQVTCPMCRTPWEEDEGDVAQRVKDKGRIGMDGYVNVARQLGISPIRDHSTYYTGPRRGQYYDDYEEWD